MFDPFSNKVAVIWSTLFVFEITTLNSLEIRGVTVLNLISAERFYHGLCASSKLRVDHLLNVARL